MLQIAVVILPTPAWQSQPCWGPWCGGHCTSLCQPTPVSYLCAAQACASICSHLQVRARLPPGVDGWGYSLKGMMSMVVVGGLIITATYWALQRTVVPRVQAGQPKKKKNKSHMGMGESFNFLAKSPYIRDLATLVSPQWPAWPACACL